MDSWKERLLGLLVGYRCVEQWMTQVAVFWQTLPDWFWTERERLISER